MNKEAKAAVDPIRQRTQYSCMAASMTMCLKALGYTDLDEDQVNRVMGAQPMKGAAWEQALACAQHYGCRATLTMPATVEQLKAWTDAGVPVMIAWNPEGRPWSHASVVFDVDDDLNVYVADPNIPNPKETVRIVTEDDFYHKWFEQFPNYLVRRPACAIEREITLAGQQVNILAGEKDQPAATKLLARQKTATGKMSDMSIRPREVLADHYAQWRATSKAFGKALARSIRVPGLTEVDDNLEGSVRLNLGPLFGVRYYGVHFQFGGSTVPNAKMPPTFSASFFPSMGGRQDWPNIPVKELERDLNITTMKVLTQAFAPFGRTKAYAGGSAAPGHGTTVFLDTQDQVEHAWNSIDQAAVRLGRAVSQVIEGYAAEFKRNKQQVVQQVQQQLADAQRNLQTAMEGLEMARATGNEEDERWYDRQRNTADLAVLRLTEQLEGMTKMAKGPVPVPKTQDERRREQNRVEVGPITQRNLGVKGLIDRGNAGGGSHKNKQDYERGYARRPKHPGREMEARLAERYLAAAYSGNPDGKPIYDVEINHGEHQPLSGGHDIMKRLQDQYRIEQGHPPREPNPRLAADAPTWVMTRLFSGVVSDAFLDRVRAHPELKHLLGRAGRGWNLYFADYFDDPRYNGGSEYDVMFTPASTGGWVISVGAEHGKEVIQKLSQMLRVTPTRQARWNANTSGQVEHVERVARRYMAAQEGSKQ